MKPGSKKTRFSVMAWNHHKSVRDGVLKTLDLAMTEHDKAYMRAYASAQEELMVHFEALLLG